MTHAAPAAGVLADPLVAHSRDVLRAGQAESGAYVASPEFAVYRYAWLRDGGFCAYAMDLLGEHDSAARFHLWVAAAVEAQCDRIEELIARLGTGDEPSPAEMLPARFALDGRPEASGDEAWPNFQLDGYGIWLWALEQHLGDGASRPLLARAVDLCARYLAATWRVPCWGCWEEFDDGQHASTLAAIAAGFDAAARLLGDPSYNGLAAQVRRQLVNGFVSGDRFKRCASDDRVDGSLLWLAIPFLTLPLSDERMGNTVEAVRAGLVGPGGGVYRYRGDSYYGGGQWILLTCWLGWLDALAGRRDEYVRARE
jgi:GH15 family glucan-1,4-alpha-glucosidase